MEVESWRSGLKVHTDGCHKNTKKCKNNSVGRIGSHQPADTCHGDKKQDGHFSRAEMKTSVSQCWAKEGQDDHTDGSTDTGSQVCCKEGLTRSLSDSCHRISVKGCHDSRAISRNIEENG